MAHQIEIQTSWRSRYFREIERLDETFQRMNGEFLANARQNPAADAAEKGEHRLWRVTGSAQRTHAQVIVALRQFLPVGIHDQRQVGESLGSGPGR